VSLSLTAPSGIPGNLPVVCSLAKHRGSAWWTKYFPRFYGIKIGNNSESKEGSTIGDFRKDSEIESNSEFKKSSAIGAPVGILRRVPVRWNSGRRQLYIVTLTFIPGFLLFGPGGTSLILQD